MDLIKTIEENANILDLIYKNNKEYGHKYIYGLLIEEMAELTVELLKAMNQKGFSKERTIEELADVEITLEQTRRVLLGLDFENLYLAEKNKKLKKTAERLGLW